MSVGATGKADYRGPVLAGWTSVVAAAAAAAASDNEGDDVTGGVYWTAV